MGADNRVDITAKMRIRLWPTEHFITAPETVQIHPLDAVDYDAVSHALHPVRTCFPLHSH